MKIIKHGTPPEVWPKRGSCSTCQCVVEVDRTDVQNMAERPGEPTVYGVKCPTPGCHSHIYFKP